MILRLLLIAFLCMGFIPAQAAKSQKALSKMAFVIKKGKYKNMKAYASSYGGKFTPDNAFDGDGSTFWVSRGKMPCWIVIDLGKEVTINKIKWRGDRGGTYHSRIAEDYRFTGSLTGEFVKEHFIIVGKENNRKNSGLTHDFKPVKVRFVRMEIFSSYPKPKWNPEIDEIDILPYPEELKVSENVKAKCKSPWQLFGIIEELRANGYEIPKRLNEIEKETCFNLNIEKFFKQGTYKKRLKEALAIINKMSWINGTPKEYTPFKKISSAKKKSSRFGKPQGILKIKS
jgi:F5/8 type C domain